MKSSRIVSGSPLKELRQDWDEFESLLRYLVMADFVWMFVVELENGARMHCYRHKTTLRDLYLSDDSRAFEHLAGDRYLEIDPGDALVDACGAFGFWQIYGRQRWRGDEREHSGLREVLPEDGHETIP